LRGLRGGGAIFASLRDREGCVFARISFKRQRTRTSQLFRDGSVQRYSRHLRSLS
jgi:hypothetical protein